MPSVLSFVLSAVLYASYVAAAPWPADVKHGTHRRHIVGRGLEVEHFHPRSTYKTYGAGIDHPQPEVLKREDSLKAASSSFIASELGLDESKIQWQSGSSGAIAEYAFLRQSHDNITFANAVANVAMKEGKVVAFGNSFVDTSKIASSTPSVSLEDAISVAESQLEATKNSWTPNLQYFAKDDGSVALTHVVQLRNNATQSFYQAYVDAHSGELLSLVDFVAKATYTVLPINKVTLDEGQETLTDPEDLEASPFGWHSDGQTETTDTSGNNVFAFIGDINALTQESSQGLVFDFPYDVTKEPNQAGNPDAARVNGFFVYNTVHDIAYRYGFTEETFNFQLSNLGNGGEENDPVLVSVQDPSGTDNAFFSTPPDGQPGETSMFVFTATTPKRDGALENDVPVHEATHGVTSRMTGGGSATCLQTLESGGLGEGWSDAMAEWVKQTDATISDFVVGAFVGNDPKGLRTFPYSTDPNVNPLTFADVPRLNEVHLIGEVWANMLHNVYAALVEANGFSATAHTDPTGTAGNVVFLHDMIDALLLQPCNPGFVEARDAIIQADQNRFNGANVCTIMTAFASRGLGANASARRFTNDFTVPAECQ